MIDGHIHIIESLLPYLQAVRCIANADSPQEYHFLHNHGFPIISAGIHPWKADTTAWESMEPILHKATAIGEIGLDNVWCAVDMDIQREVFCRQLELASRLQKPVILHTKGMEQEVLHTIRQYPNRYLVHWYSCKTHLQDYISMGCWFTVGPDVLTNDAVKELAQTVPLDRLLIESDGLEALSWAQGKELTPCDYPKVMNEHLEAVAALRNLHPHALLQQMEHNLRQFLHATAGCFADP